MLCPADVRVIVADLLKTVFEFCGAVIVMEPFPEPACGETSSHESLLEATHPALDVIVISLVEGA